jgi:hypothetical protein
MFSTDIFKHWIYSERKRRQVKQSFSLWRENGDKFQQKYLQNMSVADNGILH